ncbi:MAG: WD40 repeat domain-containing protein [Planctomycetes bacterium]|nr:WD40 repeat domain-containing protein [Planctomycetota bacterium]
MQILTVPKDKPLRLAFSPDGRYLAGGGGRAFHLWDLIAGPKPLWSLPKSDLALNFIFTPDGSALRGGSHSEFARYDTLMGRSERDSALCVLDPALFSPDGRFGLTVGIDRDGGTLWLSCAAITSFGYAPVWEKRIRYDPQHEPSGYRVLLFSVDGNRVVRVAGRGTRDRNNTTQTRVEVFDAGDGKLIAHWVGKLPYYAGEGAIDPSGAVALFNGRALHIIDPSEPDAEPVKRVNASPKPLEAVAFSRDGSRFVAVGRDAVATLWDATNWEVKRRYEWKIGPLKSVCFAPDGLRCAAGSDTGQVVVWDLDD